MATLCHSGLCKATDSFSQRFRAVDDPGGGRSNSEGMETSIGEGDNARASQPWMCAPVVGCGCCGGGGGWLASTKRWKAKKMASNRPVPRSTSRTFTALVSFALVSVCAAWVVPGAAMGRLATAMSRVATSTSREEIAVKERRAVPPWDAELSEMQTAVDSFDAREYVAPLWARNPHLHTIVASGDMEKKLLGDRTPLPYWRERWPTPDGDFVDIDWLEAYEQGGEEIDKGKDMDPQNSKNSRNGKNEGGGGGGGEGPDMNDADPGVQLPSALTGGVDYLTNENVEPMEQLRESAALAQDAYAANLGVGHPLAPETVHKEHPSWMQARAEQIRRVEAASDPGVGERRESDRAPRRLVVLLHGLEGSSTAPVTTRFSSVYARNGFDVAAINFRGCSGELGKYPMGYHLGFTQDLLHVIEEIHRRFPDTWDRLYLSGFSLGGNVIVKFLGEQGDRARELGIYGASVGCVPFEPQLGAEKLANDPVGRYLYMPVFLDWLNIKATEHARAYPDVLKLEEVQNIKSFSQFDSKVTLPIFGFESTEEYYAYVNAANYLEKVRVPLMVINARDDPFIDRDSLPTQERVGDAPVRLIYHNHGGHCGFMDGLLSSVMRKSQAYRFTQKWALPWGVGGWLPWGGGSGKSSAATAVAAAAAAAAAVAVDPSMEVASTATTVVPTAATSIASTLGEFHGAEGNGLMQGMGDAEQSSDGTAADDGRNMDNPDVNGGSGSGEKVSREGRWLPIELARFVEHLDSSIHTNGRSQQQGQNQQQQQSWWRWTGDDDPLVDAEQRIRLQSTPERIAA